jgi:hypothetical protein
VEVIHQIQQHVKARSFLVIHNKCRRINTPAEC